MMYKNVIYSGHSIGRMFERFINLDDVEKSIKNGMIIEEYPDDKPYPGFLMLHFINEKAIHNVTSFDKKNKTIYVITSYYPDAKFWKENFKDRI